MMSHSACLHPGALSLSALALWSSSEGTQTHARPEHSRELGGPASVSPGLRSPEMLSSSRINVEITCNLALQRRTAAPKGSASAGTSSLWEIKLA